MGDPRKPHKKYGSPKKPWDRTLLEHERALVSTYGLRNKKELRIADASLRKKRANAKKLLALPLEQRIVKEKELLDSLVRMGIMRGQPALGDVLLLTVEAFLERRLQTIVFRKKLSNTMKQARQFIVHGRIGINGKKLDVPSYLVLKTEEDTVKYYGKPMILQSPEQQLKDKKEVEKQFAEMRGEPEPPVNPEAAEIAARTEEENKIMEEGK
jgi:small subunit ribosomal protein S4